MPDTPTEPVWHGPWLEEYAAAAAAVQDVLDGYTSTEGRIAFRDYHGDRAIATLLMRGWRPLPLTDGAPDA